MIPETDTESKATSLPRHYNTNTQVEALETLLRKLPGPTTPAPPSTDRPKPGRARQLDANQTQALIQSYTAGATTYELGARFGIDRQTVSESCTDTACRGADVASPPPRSTKPSTFMTLAGHWPALESTSTSTTPPCSPNCGNAASPPETPTDDHEPD